MRKTKCIECSNDIPVHESYVYKENSYCTECLNKKIESGTTILDSEVTQELDPTVCSNCHYDNGNNELQKISNFPLCGKCYKFMMNRPFPKWIKMSAAALVIIVSYGLLYNAKYLFAYFNIRESNKLVQEGKFEEAYKSMRAAANDLPNIVYLKGMSDLYEGMYHMSNDDPKKALSLFNSYKNINPQDTGIAVWISRAESSIAYDSKDYKTFYLKQKEEYKQNPDNYISIAGVASGASCMYATTKNNKYKSEALHHIKLAREKAKPEHEKFLNEYIQRIDYRLNSGEIISLKEYNTRFPQGWKGGSK